MIETDTDDVFQLGRCFSIKNDYEQSNTHGQIMKGYRYLHGLPTCNMSATLYQNNNF